MNRTALKNYAPQARREFIQAMTDRAAFYGLTAENIEPVIEQGDVALIGGKAFPKAVATKRKRLEVRVKRDGFAPTMEAMAYTWFNRLVAIRYMELHGYLEHGYRVLSNSDPSRSSPEILEQAQHLELPGLKSAAVIEMKLDGNPESELYRMILVCQCNALHSAMPFLFEKIDDETELLLPDNLLHSDSLIRKLVNEIDEEDWQEVEIIGWLYQFYISERKDEVIGKVVASEDIPAATQLFTPNWIVKYLVQNTLGRQWLATYPHSALRQQMEYYIEPAEQTPEVQEQLKAITPTSLNPEELTLLDPACGSGHILVEAYDLFKAIYQERGYRAKDIPALILNKNLFGLEIDDRAAQLAAFALMMKARADDRRIFDSEAKPNVVAIQDSKGLNAADITHALNSPINKEEVPKEYLFEEIQEEKDGLFSKKFLAKKGHVSQADIAYLVELFENAKTFGSLIQVSSKLAAKLSEIEKRLDDVLKFGDLTHASAHVLKPLLQQAQLLARQYDAIVANPPYMDKGINSLLKSFAQENYVDTKSNLFSMFMDRSIPFVAKGGRIGLITMHSWMFLSRYREMREAFLSNNTIEVMAHLGPRAFGAISGEVVQTTAFVLRSHSLKDYRPTFHRLIEGDEAQKQVALLDRRNEYSRISQKEFARIPGSPVAYWVSDAFFKTYENTPLLGDVMRAAVGLNTGDNSRFLRMWYEINVSRIMFACQSVTEAATCGSKWFPYNKGGSYRKWYGNCELVLNWERDGKEVKDYAVVRNDGKHWSRYIQNLSYMFLPGITWSDITTAAFAARQTPAGFLFDVKGSSGFPNNGKLDYLLGLLCSHLTTYYMKVLNPTTTFQVGDLSRIPYKEPSNNIAVVERNVARLVSIAKEDWDSRETSWDFRSCALVSSGGVATRIQQSFESWSLLCTERITNAGLCEAENNTLISQAYGLQTELSPEVPDDQITLYRPDREEDIKRLLSYAIGCMLGRYSLDKPGLIYAHSGNQGFDPSQYKTFRADDDGIIPLLETDWGIRDDATNRFVEFIGVAWPKERLEENLKFVADSLGSNNGEQPRDTIRRYLATGFYKHHLSMYKKRPIYWLFSSGKQRAFQCLVYLHRYHEGTLARMRTEYVIPLQGRYTANIEQLATDISSATSTSQRKKLEKERDKLIKQQAELQSFDEKLKHAADQRISLDLDDGVKVNYGKFSDPQFGEILADVKAITGGKDED